MEKIVDEEKFFEDHRLQIHDRAQKDIFFIWMLVMFISVLGAYFVLNLGASPTGFVTANQDMTGNMTLLLGAFMLLFIVVLITALIYFGITQKDHPFF
jgi:uncharacterized membrane protein YhaH (DUF805 family)